jgi:copper chaperone NosL
MNKIIVCLITLITLASCKPSEPTPIKLNSDSCDFCKMTISNSKYATELITEKGRIYVSDDISCMIKYAKSNTTVPYSGFYANDYLKENKFIEVEKGSFLMGGTIKAPMGGTVAVFSSAKEANDYKSKLNAVTSSWKEVYNSY